MPTCSPLLSLSRLQVLTRFQRPSLIFLRIHSLCSQALLPWPLGPMLLEYLAQALLIQTTVVWHTRVKREAEHRVRGLNYKSLLAGQSDMKDEENSLATDTMAILQCTTLRKIVLDAEFSMQINPNYIKIMSQK